MSAQSIKPGWKMVKFGDIAQNVAVRIDPSEATTDVYVGLEHLDPETLHLRQWGHPSDVTGQKLVFKKGDVIFGRRRAYQRKLAVAEYDGICSAHAMVVRAKPEMILPEFLPFFLQSDMFMERAIEISVGSLSPTINWKTIRIQAFPLPPIKEQKRIAEILWTVDEVSEQYRRVYNSCAVLLRYLLTKNFLKKSDGCKQVEVSSICKVQTGYGFKSKDYKEEGIPLVRISNIQEPYVNLEERPIFLPQEFKEKFSKFLLKNGDILVALSGATTGKVGIFKGSSVALLNQRVGRLVFRDDARISKRIFIHLFYLFRERILADSYGGAQPNISPKNIEKYKIFIPQTDESELIIKIKSIVASRDITYQHLYHVNQVAIRLREDMVMGAAHV